MAGREVDVAIIGAGTAGLAAFRAARVHTDSVVLIEGGPYGTTCARTGCMPSKLLIAAADAAAACRGASSLGINTGAPRIDGRAVMARDCTASATTSSSRSSHLWRRSRTSIVSTPAPASPRRVGSRSRGKAR